MKETTVLLNTSAMQKVVKCRKTQLKQNGKRGKDNDKGAEREKRGGRGKRMQS